MQKYELHDCFEGEEDLICQGDKLVINQTGNEGMTKGGQETYWQG